MSQLQVSGNCKLAVIIDDNEVDCFIAKTLMEESGFTESLQLFTSPLKALEYLQDVLNQNKFLLEDVFIFLDLHMPELNGIEFLWALRETKPSAVSRVHILSSEFEKIQQKVVNGFMVAGFISKPLSTNKLQKLLKHGSSSELQA